MKKTCIYEKRLILDDNVAMPDLLADVYVFSSV